MSHSKPAQGLWKNAGLSISLHTNGDIISPCWWYLVVEQKEPLWKQLPRDPPSGGRDTACQDFQRAAAENATRQEWFISLSHFTEFPWFRYYFNLSAAAAQRCVSLLMIPVWARLILEHAAHTNQLVRRLLCVGMRAASITKSMRMHYSVYDKTVCLCEWVSADRCW